MGDPKKPRRKWEGPGHPWIKERLLREQELMGIYGLRNKRELWIAETFLRKVKAKAKALLKLPPDQREAALQKIVNHLYRLGILNTDKADLSAILSLDVSAVLERRLQTIVWRKGLAKTIHQARQLIAHGHIAINGRRIKSPGYLVPRDEENSISFYVSSPFAKSTEEVKEGVS